MFHQTPLRSLLLYCPFEFYLCMMDIKSHKQAVKIEVCIICSLFTKSLQQIRQIVPKMQNEVPHFFNIAFLFLLSVKGGQHVRSVCQTLASVHGVSLLRPVFTLLLISPSSPTGSAETGMTGKILHLQMNAS